MNDYYCSMERRFFLVLLAAIIVLGAYLRLKDLGGPSLWLDEILHLNVTQSLADVPWYRDLGGVREVNGGTENGSLYYRLQILGQKLAPGETGVRLFPAFIGILTLPLMALTGRLLGGNLVALAATFLLAVSPLHVYFSREGRPYYLLMAMALLLLYALLQKGSRTGIWIAYLGCPVTTYVGLHSAPILMSFWILSCIALGWDLRQGSTLRTSPYRHYLIAASLALSLAYGLYMTHSKINVPVLDSAPKQVDLQKSPVFQSPFSKKSLDTFLASMTTSGHPTVKMVRRSWVLIAGALFGLIAAVRRPRDMVSMAGMFFLPAILSIAALMSVGRWYGMRYTSSALPAFLLLVAFGIAASADLLAKGISRLDSRQASSVTRRTVISWGLVGVLLLVFVAPNLTAAQTDPYRKLDWRGVAQFFDEVAIDGEPVIVPNAWPLVCLDYYLRERGRTVEFISAWESKKIGKSIVAERQQGWLLTAGFRKKNEVRDWMHRFPPVLRKRHEEMALFFFPDFITLLETRFAAQKGAAFERQFNTMEQRFEFVRGDAMLQGRGWSRSETNKQGLSFQWAQGKQVALGLPIEAPRDTSLRLRARPMKSPDAPPQMMELWLNAIHLATVELPEAWSEHQVDVPASAWSQGANILYLRFSRSTRPSEVIEGSNDSRLLSAAFDYLEVVD